MHIYTALIDLNALLFSKFSSSTLIIIHALPKRAPYIFVLNYFSNGTIVLDFFFGSPNFAIITDDLILTSFN